MGFNDKWIKLMMSCVSTVSYSILVNGNPDTKFMPSRGLKQGDSLSPYLFLMCVEDLSALINQSKRRGETQDLAEVEQG